MGELPEADLEGIVELARRVPGVSSAVINVPRRLRRLTSQLRTVPGTGRRCGVAVTSAPDPMPSVSGVSAATTTFGIFDTFESEDAREAHVNGQIPAALQDVGSDLLAEAADIKPVDVVAVK